MTDDATTTERPLPTRDEVLAAWARPAADPTSAAGRDNLFPAEERYPHIDMPDGTCNDCALPLGAHTETCPWCWACLAPDTEFDDVELEHVDLGDDVCLGQGQTLGGVRHGIWRISGYGMYGLTRERYVHGVLDGTATYTNKATTTLQRYRRGIKHGLEIELLHPLYRPPFRSTPFLAARCYDHGVLIWQITEDEIPASQAGNADVDAADVAWRRPTSDDTSPTQEPDR